VEPVSGFGSGVFDFMVQVELQYLIRGFQAGENAVFNRVADLGIFLISPNIQGYGKLIGFIDESGVCHVSVSTLGYCFKGNNHPGHFTRAI
jgi:hypothetical protein